MLEEAAQAAIQEWRTSHTTGIDAQAAASRAALQSQSDKLHPAPTDMQVQTMVQPLSAFDPLEVEILYGDASDAERRVIEAAAETAGRQPRRVANPAGDSVVWDHLLAPERIAASREGKIAEANPEGAAALRDLEHIRSTYDALAAAATGMLRDSLPAHAVAVPVA